MGGFVFINHQPVVLDFIPEKKTPSDMEPLSDILGYSSFGFLGEVRGVVFVHSIQQRFDEEIDKNLRELGLIK